MSLPLISDTANSIEGQGTSSEFSSLPRRIQIPPGTPLSVFNCMSLFHWAIVIASLTVVINRLGPCSLLPAAVRSSRHISLTFFWYWTDSELYVALTYYSCFCRI
ncbi:uncharacterized protein EDB93DRAFT_1137140 [Suillus bovinus]|uniref:uncharacterized protein n=1 Tax=Suillus bovinus TaxID=48563 RepID=UPI001B86AC16|nr:uncharacterized protein EDB93DRAFT_1137140 [Suillus bovinus]KAG2152562.1 hypothetical protein EDB93DRAFT_1137140 [Suillus bovinus]